MAAQIKPLIVIVGPTASGKTSTAITLAKKLGGEVISADSRTVFREMDIGTAKPTSREQSGIPHWGIDLTAPGQRFTAAAFQRYATQTIADIRARGRHPIITGGTGLYIDGVIFEYDFPREPTPEQRAAFESMTQRQLYEYCIKNNISLPHNDKNKRHLVRAALQGNEPTQRRQLPIDNSIIVGIATKYDEIEQAIADRTEQMFEDGVVEEARMLGKKYGWESEAMTGNIYPLIRDHLENGLPINQVKATFLSRDRQLAKRQMTWFRRNPHIVWLKRSEIVPYVEHTISHL